LAHQVSGNIAKQNLRLESTALILLRHSIQKHLRIFPDKKSHIGHCLFEVRGVLND
jgi:hypothetical protein